MTMKYNYHAIEIASRHLNDVVEEIDEKMRILEGKLEVLKSDWAGGQTVAYQDAKVAWNRQVEGMRQTLANIDVELRKSAVNIDGTDREAATGFSRIG